MRKIILIILLFGVLCFAANEIQFPYEKDNTVYFRIFNSAGKVWNTGTAAFETWSDANVANYDTALADTSGGLYIGTFPAIADGNYVVISFLQSGVAPLIDDSVLSAGLMRWKDNAELLPATNVDVNDIIVKLNSILMPRTKAGRAN